MMLNSLEDILAGAAPDIGRRWLSKIRSAKNLRGLNEIGDGELLSVHESLMHILAGWFDRSADRNVIGAFFVMMGKEYCAQGIAVSELTFALSLDRKSVSEHLVEGAVLEGAHRMYALMEYCDELSEFFMLGAYYLTKGFLEETFLRISSCENLPGDILTKYFKDDFFFKAT
ncbi:MAG TPA: hypothetical protein VMC79_00640 [Rectinemataceae bacterium]|nr:hypothetical protein [Rectinemataceae bacterium]